MPSYINGRICLTAEESAIFQQRLSSPDALAASRRDTFLRDISQELTVTQMDGGVFIEFSPEKQNPVVITSTYNAGRRNADVHGCYAEEASVPVKFSSRTSGVKRQIRYSNIT